MARSRILVVDDETEIVTALKLRLEDAGYEVITATDGYHATRTAMEYNPDLVILDIRMPGGNGYEVVRCLRRSEATASVPIIMVTAHQTSEECRRAVKAGVDRYMTKPFDSDKLLQAVEDLVSGVKG